MFWESVLPATGVMFVLFSVIFFGIVLVSGSVMSYERRDWSVVLGVLMIIAGASFIFACFGWACGQGSRY